jgi:predicted transcriptional regulator
MTRLTGKALEVHTKKAISMYSKGKSIREISEETGRSYGAVHRVLALNGVTFRGRGGKRK